MKYTLTNACTTCPFRRNRSGFLRRSRAIAHGLLNDQPFVCHMTTDDNNRVTEQSQHCAGALIVLSRMQAPHQAMRIAHRLGLYDPSKLKMTNPNIFSNLRQFIEHHERCLPGIQGLVRRQMTTITSAVTNILTDPNSWTTSAKNKPKPKETEPDEEPEWTPVDGA